MTDETRPTYGDTTPAATPPGLVHAYQAYDPRNFPSPTQPPPDFASAAMEHLLAYGSMRELTPEELANAIRLDPSQIAGLVPSLDALAAMLEDRKRRLLEKYETKTVQRLAEQAFTDSASQAKPEGKHRQFFDKAVRDEQLSDLETLWFAQRNEQSDFSKSLMRVINDLANKYQIDELASKYEFKGHEALTIEEALALKEELEAIDKLQEQIKEAAQTAQLAIIDMDQLAEFAESAQIEELNQLQQQIEEYVRQEAERQGIEQTNKGFRITPRAMRLFQGRLLTEIFASLEAARSGRHSGPIVGDGPTELPRTRAYEFGDSAANMDVTQSLINAMIRVGPSARARIEPRDIEVYQTRNNPKAATVVLMDMSGSMRYDGQYINVKRMALALDGLIRREYPGDYLKFIEMFSFARVREAGEIATMMPKPVSMNSPVVRLKVDMADPEVPTGRIPQHFTNIQRAMQLGRTLLSAQDTPNRQMILITDGLPTAHFEGSELFLLYPPDPRTEEATMREANLCAREGITLNIFLLPSWSQSSEDVAFAHRMTMATRGRVFFTGGRDLDRFVLWDYLAMRRKIIA
ncbi:MAG: hypothetical protein SFY96_06415 [Planctomycetota bacterium]|nr:hypothetical protein [Planctomycetota bacterium]